MQFPAQKKWRGFIAALGEASILANQSGWRDWRACQEAFPAEKKDAKNIQLHAHTKYTTSRTHKNIQLPAQHKIYNFTHSKKIKYFTHTQKNTSSRRELHNFMHVIMQIKGFHKQQPERQNYLRGEGRCTFSSIAATIPPYYLITTPCPSVLKLKGQF